MTAENSRQLQTRLHDLLVAKKLLEPGNRKSRLHWNSPTPALPHIVNLSVAGYPSALLAKLLEERGCYVSVGSACSSQKVEPDAVLTAMGLPSELCQSSIRISFSGENTLAEVDTLVNALDDSIQMMARLLGPVR